MSQRLFRRGFCKWLHRSTLEMKVNPNFLKMSFTRGAKRGYAAAMLRAEEPLLGRPPRQRGWNKPLFLAGFVAVVALSLLVLAAMLVDDSAPQTKVSVTSCTSGVVLCAGGAGMAHLLDSVKLLRSRLTSAEGDTDTFSAGLTKSLSSADDAFNTLDALDDAAGEDETEVAAFVKKAGPKGLRGPRGPRGVRGIPGRSQPAPPSHLASMIHPFPDTTHPPPSHKSLS